ncbi:MAG TPA: glycosyltransferase family A protein [Pyrinomonadaceae bacterium]
MPLISVCVPTYNYGRFLPDCIESVLAQTLSDWELIICDDCSTDNTSDIVQEYAKSDPRIRYFGNAERLGMNGNIKKAAELGKGRYIKMLCSDDWLASDCLEAFVGLMEQNPGVSLATAAEVLSDEEGHPIQVQFLFGEPVSIVPGERMLNRMARGDGFGGHSSFFIRTSAYKAIGGYDGKLVYASDMDVAARLCRIGDYLHTDLPLFYGRVQSTSSSAVNPGKLLDVIDSFEIPDKIFRPRSFPNREWLRYQLLTANLTARYLTNIVLQTMRGQHEYARKLRALLKRYGNFVFGIPLLGLHIPTRIYRRVSGRSKPTSLKPPVNAGTPSALRRLNSQAEI